MRRYSIGTKLLDWFYQQASSYTIGCTNLPISKLICVEVICGNGTAIRFYKR